MQPLKLKLKNFCSIAEMELDLSALSLVGISAPNGTGKSSVFTYSPLWALFGKSRPGCGIDDLVKTGTQDMSVTFDFEHNGEIYQVTRTRNLKGKGKTTCEFLKQIPTGWESLTAPTKISDTDKRIEALLSLDSNTFLASSMILQGDANNFTRKLPSERKQVLSSILGLDIYSTLQEQAKLKVKALELKLEGSKQNLERLSKSIEVLPTVESELQQVKQSIALVSIDIRQKETELSDIQNQIKDLKAKQTQAEQIQKQIDALTNETNTRKTEIVTLNNRIINAETILKSEPELLNKVKELAEIRQQIPVLEIKVNRLKELQIEVNKLESESDKLTGEEHELAAKIMKLTKELSIKVELQIANEQYQQSLVELRGFDEKAEKAQALSVNYNIAESNLKLQDSFINGLNTELAQLEKKVEMLGNSGCIDSANAKCKFLSDAQEASTRTPILKKDIEQALQNRDPLLNSYNTVETALFELAYDPNNHATIKRQSESLRKQVEQYAALSGKEELLQALTEQKQGLTDRINANLEQQDTVGQQIAEIKKEVLNLSVLQRLAKELEPYEKQLAELPQAKAVIESAKEQIQKMDDEIAIKQDAISAYQITLQQPAFGKLEQLLSAAQAKQSETQTDLKDFQSSLNTLFVRQGALQSQLDTLTADQTKRATMKQEIAPMAKELVRWETLVKAFSKNGIPVLILENALPELERIANDILGQMSAGAHTLQFITQRDAKSKDSQIETLDILVSDWAGTRPYESFSGGEQTRISIAIRFALSELLANRSGSKIEFIIGDEFLSDQSPEFRDMTIEGIKNLAGRFKKILIISHIPEIQAAFDQRIILSEGGKVRIEYN